MSNAPQNTTQGSGGPASPAMESLAPVVTLGGVYRIEEQIGDGGLGALYRAVDTRSDMDVALRVLRPELAADATLLGRTTTS